ncbi:MAG: GIY-YIG nuclease family protein [Bdellovibrionales bacterium]|nr:GIY-YIG nuclease family protein [Bdellovibrionales bacterium]
MAKKRDTVTYKLKKGNKTVYIGKTKNPERREQQHQREGKSFSKLIKSSRRMTEEEARKKEQRDLQEYRRTHDGKNPKYNRDSDG